jgi:hypothetical protein
VGFIGGSRSSSALVAALAEAGLTAPTPRQARLATDALIAHLEDGGLALVTIPPAGPNRGQVERIIGGAGVSGEAENLGLIIDGGSS